MAILDRLRKKRPEPPPQGGGPTRPPIWVLIVDDDEDDFILARDILYEVEEQPYAVRWARTYDEAVQEMNENHFDVFLIDYNLGERNGLEFLRNELLNGTKSPGILVTGTGARRVDEEGMKYGASGFMVKWECNPAEMERVIRYAIEGHRAKVALMATRGTRSSKVISFVGAKGGVGTTTAAVNVAVALAQRGKSVTAIDMRSYYGTLAQQLNMGPTRDMGELLAIETADVDTGAMSEHLAVHSSGLRVLASPQTIEGYGELDPQRALAVTEAAAASAEYVVIDLAAPQSPGSHAVIERSDLVILIMSRESTCLTSAEMCLRLLASWRIDGTVGTVVMDRVVVPERLAAGAIAASLDVELYGYVAADKDVFHECITTGTPLVMSSQSHYASQAFNSVADMITNLGDSAADGADAGRPV